MNSSMINLEETASEMIRYMAAFKIGRTGMLNVIIHTSGLLRNALLENSKSEHSNPVVSAVLNELQTMIDKEIYHQKKNEHEAEEFSEKIITAKNFIETHCRKAETHKKYYENLIPSFKKISDNFLKANTLIAAFNSDFSLRFSAIIKSVSNSKYIEKNMSDVFDILLQLRKNIDELNNKMTVEELKVEN